MTVCFVTILIEVFAISIVWTHCWDSVRVKRGSTHGLKEFEKNILKNEEEKYVGKEKFCRNEINPQYTSPVLVWVIESQKMPL
jgi:hypothetical protein